jgi:hypothetical protein
VKTAESRAAARLPGSGCRLQATSQADAPGHLGTLPGVAGRGHGVVGLEPELLAIGLRRELVRDVLGRDLMPYAPVHIQASGSWGANITLAWRRRTRIGGALVDGTGVVPLAEDAEAYEVEILDGPGGAVLRTQTVAETSFAYTTAMQGSDFGAAQTELTLRVCQISAQVGRGFAGETTLEIP